MALKVKVEGELVTRDHNGNAIEFYEEEFILGADVRTKEQAHVIVKKALLDDRLRRGHKGYKRFRTAQIVEFGTTDEPAEQSDIDKLLIKATALNCIPENLNNYKRPDHKQRALEKAIALAEARKPEKSNVQDLGYVD
jgi:hypothetical protein